MTSNLIRTFQPGDRVRVLPGPYERICPGCHMPWGTLAPRPDGAPGTILYVWPAEDPVHCGVCGHVEPMGPGYYAVSWGPYREMAVPWTRLISEPL